MNPLKNKLYYEFFRNFTSNDGKDILAYYEENSQEIDKVLDIFIRMNSGGTTLTYSDLLLSLATAKWQNLNAREEIYSLVDELNMIGNGFNFNKDNILKAALVLTDKRILNLELPILTNKPQT